MKRLIVPLALFLCAESFSEDALAERLAKASPEARELMLVWDKKAERPEDARHKHARKLTEGSGFVPPPSKEEWQRRVTYLREQVLLAAGLFPPPERCPLEAVIHGKVERDGYTVEKVFFQSYPGFYVTGNLYRPAHLEGKAPGVLCPHGHWANGRFYEATDKEIQKQLKNGWERDENAARYPLQARCANLAKLGCVVFHYDMVGYADADPERFPHRKTWLTADAELRGQSVLGLQLWDSIRALDFLQALPDVDATRLACTGASGGATQTFLLMATDERLACAAPVNMISAGDHQGGCVCENADLLRVGTDNVELAAAFAPKPFIHPTATGDWTKDFLEKGFPEIKSVYRLYDAEANVASFRQTADHNYNVKSREAVYAFFNTHLKLGHPEPIVEQKFEPLKPAELSVFDAAHPRPEKSVDAAQLKQAFDAGAYKQMRKLIPGSQKSIQLFEMVYKPALAHLCNTSLPDADAVKAEAYGVVKRPTFTAERVSLSRAIKDWSDRLSGGEAIPAILYRPVGIAAKAATIVTTPQGKAELVDPSGALLEPLATLLAQGHAVLALDLFETGENTQALSGFPGIDRTKDFFAGYNRTVLGNQAHDLLTAAAWLKQMRFDRVNLLGLGNTGTACLLAGALSPKAFARVAADADRFDFDKVTDANDPRFLPSAVKFGGLWAFVSLRAPEELYVFNTGAKQRPFILTIAYNGRNAAANLAFMDTADAKALAEWVAH